MVAPADSFTGLNVIVDSETWELDASPVRGSTSLQAYVSALVG